MSRPGERFRAIVKRFCRVETMERLVDPAVADMQYEHAEAGAAHHPLRSARVLIAGYWGLLKAGAHAIATREAVRGPLTALAAIGAFTVPLVALPLSRLRHVHAQAPAAVTVVELALCVVPQALALSVPLGLVAGVLFGWRGADALVRSRRAVFSMALVCALAGFVNLGWVTPIANQEYRVLVAGGPLEPGDNELTLPGLHQRAAAGEALIERDSTAVVPAPTLLTVAAYHLRLAVTVAPLVFGWFLLSAAAVRRQWLRRWVTAGVLLAFFSCYVAVPVEDLVGIMRASSPAVVAWFPITLVALAALATDILRFRTRRVPAS